MSHIELPTAARQTELNEAYEAVKRQVEATHSETTPNAATARVVVVSKYQSSSDILSLHQQSGVRHFGENYPQELCDKAKELPTEIQWHFIGALQSNKCKLLAAIPNLFAIETLTSIKAATLLQKTLSSLPTPRTTPLNVFIQINTSSESSKSGLAPLSRSASRPETAESEVVALAKYLLTECRGLMRLKGLMTIGSYEASTAEGESNPDFAALELNSEVLLDALDEAAQTDQALQGAVDEVKKDGLELSMGMSHDYVQAIKQGSTNVRVGSKIFGARPEKKS